MRLLYMFKLERQGDNQDASYEMAWMGLWSWAEIALGIIVACTLSLPKLVRAKSMEFDSVVSSVVQRFTSFKSMSKTTTTRTRSNEAAQEKTLARELNMRAPNIGDYVHAPPGLTLTSDGGSFVIREGNENGV